MARVQLYLDMTAALRQCLPEALAESCWCGRIRGADLTVTVRTQAQASLLHFHQREVLKHLNSRYGPRLPEPLRSMRIRVAAHHDPSPPPSVMPE